MCSKKVSDCIVHGLRLPNACTTRRIRHPEIFYQPPPSKFGMEYTCLENEYMNIPPIPYHKAKWNVCNHSKKAKSYCPPPPNVYPTKPRIITLKQRLKYMFWTLVKLGVFAGVIKTTDDLRIWSTAEETESLYFTVREAISPEGDIPESELPGMQQVTYNIARKWNDGVIYTWSHLFGVHPSLSTKSKDDLTPK